MIEDKILALPELLKRLQEHRAHGGKIVFTNGCFDILHKGHVLYLEQARALGDCLVVGLNGDASVKRLKGKGRPVNDFLSRAVVLAALESVDYVCIFEEDTPLKLIKKVQPEILVKGGDWAVADIVGSEEVLARGGRVESLSFTPGFSTTKTIQKLQE